LSNDFFVAFNDGAKAFTSALGLDLTTFEDDANVNTAISQVGNIETAGGQMLFGTPASEAQAEAVIRACEEAGIYYGSAYTSPPFFTPADSPTWIRFLTPPSVTIAAQTARALFEEVGGAGTIVHVPGQPGSSADDERTAGLMQAAAEFPDIEIVTTAPGNWISEDARVAFSNALPSISDFVGVFAQNDSEAAGVIAALDAQGITGKVVTGFDGNAQNIQLIADGKQFLTSATIGGLTAGLLGIAVFDALNGVELSLPERFMHQGAVLVKQDFAAEFLENVYSGDLPFDWELMSRALHPDDWDPQTLLKPIVPSEFFANREAGEYELNPAWEAETDNIATVTADYDARFASGPLFAYKESMVA
jgi:ribose transport system substrate-binding protein